MSTTSNAAGAPPTPNPRVPESFMDIPSQRLYALSMGALLQAIKVFDFFQYLFNINDNQGSYGRKWMFVDFMFCTVLAYLRIPRLRYSLSVVALQILCLWLLDGFLFGAITINIGSGGRPWMSVPAMGFLNRGQITFTPPPSVLWDLLPTFGLGMLISSAGKDQHLLGQHTVRMSPISTARLNPYGGTFCLAAPGQSVLVPILLNNTSPTTVQYSLTPLGYTAEERSKSSVGKIETVELNAKDLRTIENARLDSLHVARTAVSRDDSDDYDEYDDEDDDEEVAGSRKSSLQKTQTLAYLRINKPGRLRLERVLDQSNVDARLVYPNEVTIVPCPRAEFALSSVSREEDIRCAVPGMRTGVGEELSLEIDIYGVPPLSLRWHKEIGGRRESFMVEGIESSGHAHEHLVDDGRASSSTMGSRAPVALKIPLIVSLDTLGMHSYVLEYITDAIGNVVPAGAALNGTSSTNALRRIGSTIETEHQPHGLVDPRTHRIVRVVRRPSVYFQGCGPGTPTSLLIGSEAQLRIVTKDADLLDSPWDIGLEYRPPTPDEDTRGKRYKGWTKRFQTTENKKELTVTAAAPGDYRILSVQGRYCEGDILSPDTCKVIERPLPTAEIEWKKIHECSGDTGVLASLVMHGTPPFVVYYSMQRDKEQPHEFTKTFMNSRGEFTIQPERSGHYVFKFTRLSDSNYQQVPLKGPSIDQVVHPPASAEFADSVPGGRGKRRINSCSGSTVDVDVDLRGTGPWNLEIQVVGPKGSEIVRVPGITTARKTITIPIPKVVDRNGGTFEIDLASIEDAYGCKRPLSGSGIVVNVRRVQPTARFYGKLTDRHVTILDDEQAALPLRLTGDGSWRLRYRRIEDPEKVYTAWLSTPNDELRVRDKGIYEILEISDSQCPGSVITEEATYRVDHVPRPSARLSAEIQSIYQPHNGSHILPPICEGISDHVDLDLTGRPPFQIMYNIAKDVGARQTSIIDQPTVSSIQPRTSFQLHTSEAARIYYEVKQIGDAAYPLSKNKDAVIPRSERLLFEQEVLRRPSARWKNQERLSYCFNDTLLPRDNIGPDGLIVLEGTAPFNIQLSIRNLATSETHVETVEARDMIWKLNMPSYTFKSTGPHLVTIESVQDASHCEQATPDPQYRSIWIDVAETAAIVPFDSRVDFCVGDPIQFQLEGTPPWTIGYSINGKSYTQEARKSPFSIVQQQPGEFIITSIAHQQKMCKAAVTDLRYTVHDLPAARVGQGKRIVQDIHEGDQAEIIFTLIGEPPFTFTYQRAELNPRKGSQPKVLETHTVSGVTTQEYSIFSALEGTWTVTFIADRYCRYPPVPPDGLEKLR